MYYIHEYPFRKVFQEAGALGVMCAYNDYDGVPMSANYHYLTEVLRGEMGFKGYVVSDSYAIGRLAGVHKVAADEKESCLQALKAGLNVRTEFNEPDTYAMYICELVNEGKLSMERVNELVRQVLYVKFWIGLFDQPYVGDIKTVGRLFLRTLIKPQHCVLQENAWCCSRMISKCFRWITVIKELQ